MENDGKRIEEPDSHLSLTASSVEISMHCFLPFWLNSNMQMCHKAAATKHTRVIGRCFTRRAGQLGFGDCRCRLVGFDCDF